MKRWWFGLFCLFSVFVLPSAGWAQSCTVANANMVFSGDPTANVPLDTTTTLKVNCQGTLLAFKQILICAHLAQGSGGANGSTRQMVNGTSKINYQIYNDSQRTSVAGSVLYPPPPPVRYLPYGAILFLGGGDLSFTLYGRVFPNQNAAIGTYTSSFAGSIFFYDGTDCNGSNGSAMSLASFNINLTVASSCSVTAQNIDFGERGTLTSNIDAKGAVNVTCTKGTPYTVSLGPGLANAGIGARKMFKGGVKGSESVGYNLYKDNSRTIVWGDETASPKRPGTGTREEIPVYARVPPQNTPSLGTYIDNVAVTVRYD
jgi:spore coat protein U-like protein